jgi:hypothetical protein
VWQGQADPGVTTTAGWFLRPSGPGLDIGEIYLNSSPDERRQEANAGFIVQAVNSHDSLVGAIEQAIELLVAGDYDDGAHPVVAGVIASLREALAEVGKD